MPRAKKTKAPDFPPVCCGVCRFFHVFDNDTVCLALPPQCVSDEDGGTWMRGAPVEPEDPACAYFQPKHHA